MSFEHDDLGIDLDFSRRLPECFCCRKKTDGFRRLNWEGEITVLCGTHFDEWLRRRYQGDHDLTPEKFAKELREGKYRPCWEAKIDE